MIKHIVFFTLKEKNSQNLDLLKTRLLELKDKISVVESLEVGENFAEGDRAMDVALTVVFSNREGLETYRNHPDHKPVIELAGKLCSISKVVDYEIL